MTVTVNRDLALVEQAARVRVQSDLDDLVGMPIVTYCERLVVWVLYGQNRPAGSPTDRVRSVVRDAVNAGLARVYGPLSLGNSRADSGVIARRDSL